MPFVSKAQQRFMFSQHPDIAKRWAAMTPDIKALPQHVSKSRSNLDRLSEAIARKGKS